MRTATRALRALPLLLLGLLAGTAAVLVHATPWGLPLVAAASAAAIWALPAGWSTRLAFAAGWTGAVGVLLTPRAAGDFLIAADTRGYLLLGLTLVLAVAALVTVPRAGPRREGSGNGRARP